MGNNSEDFLYLIDQIEEIRSKNRITKQEGKGVGYHIVGESNKIK